MRRVAIFAFDVPVRPTKFTTHRLAGVMNPFGIGNRVREEARQRIGLRREGRLDICPGATRRMAGETYLFFLLFAAE